MLYNLVIIDDISCEVEDLRGLLFDQVKVLLVEGVRNGLVHGLAEFVDHSGSGLDKINLTNSNMVMKLIICYQLEEKN